jgi:hypothetical protein
MNIIGYEDERAARNASPEGGDPVESLEYANLVSSSFFNIIFIVCG